MQYINYRENKKRGTADFPIELHHVDKTHPQYTMPYHWHMELELLHILEGEFTLFLEEQELTLKKDHTVLIHGGCLHAGIPADCVYECLVFDMNMLLDDNDICRNYLKKIANHQFEIQTLYDDSYKNIQNTMHLLFYAMAGKKPGYQMLVKGYLYQFFGTIIGENYYSHNPVQTPKDHKRIMQVKQVLEFIENSYASPVTLEQLSRTVGMSPKYFCRFFLEMTHRTPIDYLNYYRIERACYQLITTDEPITQIALNCGFNDLSYFIKTFRRYKGTTPKKYLH